MRKEISRAALAAASAVLLAAASVSCENVGGPVPAPEENGAVSWTPSHEAYDIRVGETVVIGGTLLYADGRAEAMDAFSTSENPDIAKADGGYAVVGVAPGRAAVNAEVRIGRSGARPSEQAVFGRRVYVNVAPEDRRLENLELSPAEVTLARGESVSITVSAVYPDGTRKEVSPSLCSWEAEDDGAQHVTYEPGRVTSRQGGGWTVIRASYSESGKTVSGTMRVTSVD